MALSVQVDWTMDPAGVPCPHRFALGERFHEVSEIIDRWPGPDYGYVKLRADDGIYILRHEQEGREWTVILYDSDELEHGRPGVE